MSGGKSCLVAPGVAVPPWATETVLSPWLVADEDRISQVVSNVVWWKFEHQDSLESNMTLWKDNVTLQKVGVTPWKDRNLTNMDCTMKEKYPQGVCSGEIEYITHHTCSYGKDLDMYPATTCDCDRKFNSLRGSRIHKARWRKQRNSPAGECKSNDRPMNQDYPRSIHEPIAERQRPGDIPCKSRIEWPKGNQIATWTDLDQELSFYSQPILRVPLINKERLSAELYMTFVSSDFVQ